MNERLPGGAVQSAADTRVADADAPSPLSPLFHFAEPRDWEAAQSRGAYAPASFDSEGFIHCATAAQIPGVVQRHLRGKGQRVRLELDPAALREQLKWEWSSASGDLYPHLFAPIPLDAVLSAEPFDPDSG